MLTNRERAKAEKEKERDRLKQEKEKARLEELEREKEAEARRKEFALEMERTEQRRKEVEREKEAERERAVQELERTIAEREKARLDKRKDDPKPKKDVKTAAELPRQPEPAPVIAPVIVPEQPKGALPTSSSSSTAGGSKSKDCCIDCGKDVDGTTSFFAFGECNHRVSCETCVVRNRVLKKVMTCRQCARPVPIMVCSPTQSQYEVLSLRIIDNPSSEYSLDAASQVYFKKDLLAKRIKLLWQYRCRACGTDCTTASELKKHMWVTHTRRQCSLCEQAEHMFPSEQTPFTTELYDQHLKQHPKCTLCGTHFFDERQLVAHKSSSHPTCVYCTQSTGTPLHFSDSLALNAHLTGVHFVCTQCPGPGVSHQSDEGLRLHVSQTHEWGARARRANLDASESLRRPSPAPENTGRDMGLKASFLTYQSAELDAASDILSVGLVASALDAGSPAFNSASMFAAPLDPQSQFGGLPFTKPPTPALPMSAPGLSLPPRYQDNPSPLTDPSIGMFKQQDPLAPIDFGSQFDPGFEAGFNAALNLEGPPLMSAQSSRFGAAFNSSFEGGVPRSNSDTLLTNSLGSGLLGSSALGGSLLADAGIARSASTGFGGGAYGFSSSFSSSLHGLGLGLDPYSASSLTSGLSSGFGGIGGMAGLGSSRLSSGQDSPAFTDYSMFASTPSGPSPLQTNPFGSSSLGGSSSTSSLFPKQAGVSQLSGSSQLSLAPPLLTSQLLAAAPLPAIGLSAPLGAKDSPTDHAAGIDGDVLSDSVFPAVSWLRAYDMCMYRWAGDSTEWTEYALHLPSRAVIEHVVGENGAHLLELQHTSGCKMWLAREVLRGKEANFLVFLRGSNGQPSNTCMNMALDLISARLRPFIFSSGKQGSVELSSPQWASQMGDIDFDFVNVDLSTLKRSKNKMPEGLKGIALGGGVVQRAVEIPRDAVGIVIGQGGKKIKELSGIAGAKIQFRVNKSAEKDGRPGVLVVEGKPEQVEAGLQLVWDMLQLVGKEYVEVHASKFK
jgi:hypothetical protein